MAGSTQRRVTTPDGKIRIFMGQVGCNTTLAVFKAKQALVAVDSAGYIHGWLVQRLVDLSEEIP